MDFDLPAVAVRARGVRASGFTLVELLVTVAIMAVLIGIGLPTLTHMIQREKLLGSARELAVSMRRARLEAIKSAAPTAVAVDMDPDQRTITSFVDDDDDGVFELGERLLSRSTITAGVYPKAPSGEAIDDVVDGLETSGTAGIARFNSDGSSDAIGAFRIADGRGNFLEVRLEPASVARVTVRKWDGSQWHSRAESPGPWIWY